MATTGNSELSMVTDQYINLRSKHTALEQQRNEAEVEVKRLKQELADLRADHEKQMKHQVFEASTAYQRSLDESHQTRDAVATQLQEQQKQAQVLQSTVDGLQRELAGLRGEHAKLVQANDLRSAREGLVDRARDALAKHGVTHRSFTALELQCAIQTAYAYFTESYIPQQCMSVDSQPRAGNDNSSVNPSNGSSVNLSNGSSVNLSNGSSVNPSSNGSSVNHSNGSSVNPGDVPGGEVAR